MGKKYFAKAIDLRIGEDLPEDYLFFKAGVVQLENGPEFIVDKEGYESVRAHHARRGIDPVVDYEHQTMHGTEAPAAGWITDGWQWSGNGITAKVEWTEKAERLIKSKEYRYFSPVFEVSERKGGALGIVAIHNIGLTNDPRTNNINPLVAKRDSEEVDTVDLLAKIIAISALGLTEDATEEKVLEVIQAKLKQKPEKVVVSAKIAGALGLKEGSKEEVVIAKIKGLEAGAESGSELAEKLACLEEKLAEQQVEKLIAKHKDRITPAMQKEMVTGGKLEHLMVLAKNDPAAFESTVELMAVQVPGKLPGQENRNDNKDGELTEQQAFVAAKMGLTQDQYLGIEKKDKEKG